MTTSPQAVEKICRTDDAVLEAKQPQHQSRGCQWSCPARRPVWSLLLPAVLGPGLRRYATNTAGKFLLLQEGGLRRLSQSEGQRTW